MRFISLPPPLLNQLRRWRPIHGLALSGGLAFWILLLSTYAGCRREIAADLFPGEPIATSDPLSPPRVTGIEVVGPTPQTRWRDTEDPSVYMPTGSGRVLSAAFGSVRTNSSGQATFHEGVDIAPVSWERGKAADDIFAVAEGSVAYINRSAGNSSYGIYVVLAHEEPLGPFYTLYAHLASLSDSLQTGQRIACGDRLGRMGHSSTLGIPPQQSHLHFETALMLNPQFVRYYAREGKRNPHGNFHGFNLAGFDPRLLLFPLTEETPARFSVYDALRQSIPAWRILVRVKGLPAYFKTYAPLWESTSDAPPDAIVMDISENGLPLWGRPATPDERERLGSEPWKILGVNEDVLQRNGRRHVIQRSGQWELSDRGKNWLEILLFGAQG